MAILSEVIFPEMVCVAKDQKEHWRAEKWHLSTIFLRLVMILAVPEVKMNQSCYNGIATSVGKTHKLFIRTNPPQLQGSLLHTGRGTTWIYSVLYSPGTEWELGLVAPYGPFIARAPRTLETVRGPIPHGALPSEKVPKAQSQLRSCPLSPSTQKQYSQHGRYSG